MKQQIHAHLAKKLRTHDFTPLDVLAYGASCFDKVIIRTGFVCVDGWIYAVSKDRPLEETKINFPTRLIFKQPAASPLPVFLCLISQKSQAVDPARARP